MLVYDRDRPHRARRAAWLGARLRTPVLVVPWQEVGDLDALGLSTAEARAADWWIDIFGRRRRGHEAIAQCLRLTRGPVRLAGPLLMVPPLSWLARAAYRADDAVSRRRSRPWTAP